jgi:outer membrane protein assembly factor BamB
MTPRSVVCVLTVCLLPALASAEDWPCWRGPRGDGTSLEKGLPRTWSRTENVAWKTKIPGIGHSSPIVWGDRIFLTSCVEAEGKRLLLCLDRRSGKILWERVVLTARLEAKHNYNSFASATPATDGERVWVAFLDFPSVQIACYDFDGKKLWQRAPGKLLSRHGFCSSPMLHKDLVIVNGDQDAEGYIVALDRKTGEERWRIQRPNQTRSYCTPVFIHSHNQPEVTQMVLSGTKCVTGYDADTGKLLWILNGPTEQYVASLVYLDGVLFLTTGFPEHHLMGISPEGKGDITDSKYVLWHIGNAENGERGASYVPSPLAYEGHFFVVSDPGYLSCLETKTGKRVWMKKLGRRHSASGVLIEGNLYFTDDDGTTFVVKARPTFELVAKNPLKEECYASPAVSHGHIYLRTLEHLYAIGTPEKIDPR